MYKANIAERVRPGIIPAANILAIDNCDTPPIIIICTLGGINTPKEPPAAIDPIAICLS